MSDDADGVTAYFRDRGLEARIAERDLHAEYMARGKPGLASRFVENRRYYCIDLLRNGAMVAEQYAQGETVEDALARARQRFGSEQV